MPRGVSLSEAERASILTIHREGKSSRYIASTINRGRDAVLSVIRSGQVRGWQRRRAVKRQVTLRIVRLICRKARTGLFSARELQEKYAPMVTVRRVQQLLSADTYLNFFRVQKALMFTPAHKSARLDWARKYVLKGARFWNGVIYSDEKGSN